MTVRGQAYTMEELMNAQIPIPQGLLGGKMLLPGTLAMMAGMDGTGKTFLAIDLAMKISRGVPWGPWPTRKGTVLFVSEEMMPWEMFSRVKAMGSRLEMFDYWKKFTFRFKTEIDLVKTHERAELRAIIHAIKPDIVFIDTFRDIHSAKENDNDAMALVLQAVINEIAVPEQTCIMFLHHFKKPQDGSDDAERGASVIRAKMSDVIYLITAEDGETYIKMRKIRHDSAKRWPHMPYRIIDGDKDSIIIDISAGAPGAA